MHHSHRWRRAALAAACTLALRPPVLAGTVPDALYVDPEGGNDDHPGTSSRPLQSLAKAISLLPDPLPESVNIHLAPGLYTRTGGYEMPDHTLELMRRMRPAVVVRIIGSSGDRSQMPTFAWESERCLVDVREGDWWLEGVQVGSGTPRQRRGVMVTGPAHVTLRNLTFRTRSLSDAAIYAHRGGQATLLGAIRLNEHLAGSAPEESFCGIIATDHGLVRFAEREGARLQMGNGSLSASYYGCIRLGCDRADITCWTEQSNNLAINNGGRIDLHGTTVHLRARQRRNTPIGLEHDGHILGEDARVIIEGENCMAIALQKASTFTCNDIELRGTFDYGIYASSGSVFVGGFLGDVGRLYATTGASIHVEKVRGRILGPVEVTQTGAVSLPDRNVFSQ